MPRISLITACFNAVETLPETLTSVAGQSGADVEYIVVDGGSTDGTVGLIEGARVSRWVSEPDGGIYDALNKGISLSSGEVIGFLHADDVFAHDRVLERIAERFADPTVQASYGDLVYVARGDTARVVRYWRSRPYSARALRWGWMPPHPTFYLRRSWYERVGGFDTSYRIAADYEHMLRVLRALDGQVAYLPEVLVRMRLGGASNRSLRNLWRKSLEDRRALRANRLGGWPAVAAKNVSKLPQFVQRMARGGR